MDFSQGQMSHKGSNQHGGFTLTDERRGSGHDGLGARDTQTPEEEDGEFADEPLDEADVVQDLDERDEEDDGGHDAGQKPVKVDDARSGQERNTLVGKSEKLSGQEGDEIKDVVTSLGSEDKDGNNELSQHATDHRVPPDLATILRGSPQQGNHDGKTEERNGAVATGIVVRLLRDKGADQDDSNGTEGGQPDAEFLRNVIDGAHDGIVPSPGHGLGDDGDGNPEEDETQGDGEIEEEGFQPAEIVVAVHDETSNPPSKGEG